MTNETIPVLTHDAYRLLVAQRDRRIRALMLWRLVLLALLVAAVTWHLYRGGC